MTLAISVALGAGGLVGLFAANGAEKSLMGWAASLPLSYWLSARMPEWKAEGKSISLGSSFLMELAASAGDRKVTTTRYSDGSSTKRTTHTGLQAFSIWFFIITFIRSIILPYVIVINFWKNYVRA